MSHFDDLIYHHFRGRFDVIFSLFFRKNFQNYSPASNFVGSQKYFQIKKKLYGKKFFLISGKMKMIIDQILCFLNQSQFLQFFQACFKYYTFHTPFLEINLYDRTQNIVSSKDFVNQNIRVSICLFFVFILMTEPTPQQYEAILKYMEATNEESFDKAREALQKCDYNISVAVNSKFGGGRQGPQYQEHQEAHQDDEEIVMQYMRHLRKKQHDFSIIWGVIDFFKGIVVGLFKGISELIFPEFMKKKMIRSKFYNMYCDLLSVNITDETLANLLNRSYQTQKPIIFAICSQIGRHNPLVQILNEPRNIRKINESFIFTGAFEQDPECRRIEGEKIPPTIVICRKNVFDKIEILEKYVGDEGISIINVEQLNRVLQKSQNMRKKDRNIQIKYRNYIRRLQYGGYAGFYEEEEEQLYPERTRENTNMIRQQNEDYKRIQEENRRKIQQKEKEQKKQQELVQERQVRKMSIPDEPTEGEIVRLNFRCPDGSIRIRNFLADENLELVYNWVETNEQIEFEDNTKRQFQLMYSFPPTALSDKKSIPLKEVFDSDQEKVMIREL